MDIKELNSTPTVQNGNQPDQQLPQVLIQSSQLVKLFEDKLKDICRAEKALAKAISKMIKEATSQELIAELTSQLTQTENQITEAEQVFASMGKKMIAKKCGGLDGLGNGAGEKMKSSDAGVISTGWKATHYEMASYGTLRQFAKTLGLTEATSLLEATLNEKKTDKFNNVDYRTVFVCPGQYQ